MIRAFITATFLVFVAVTAQAQQAWVQIEAQPTLSAAQERARIYAGRYADVSGYYLGSGWYGIVIGPYPQEEAALRLEALKREGQIPADSFIAYVQARQQRPVLCFYLHPWEFHPMPQGALDFGECSVKTLPFIVKNCGPKAVAQLDRVCTLLRERGGRFLTAQGLAAEHKARN